MNRAKDWLTQAHYDIQAAESARKSGFHEWACFMAQQASEKALKATAQNRNAVLWGHSLKEMLMALKENCEIDLADNLMERARNLDKYYIIARYPNGFNTGIPHDYFGEKDSEDAINSAKILIQWCDSLETR
ncbi:MAG: HEPN domain-containing protein [bacterium]